MPKLLFFRAAKSARPSSLSRRSLANAPAAVLSKNAAQLFVALAFLLTFALSPQRAEAHGANLSYVELKVDGQQIEANLQIPQEEAEALLKLTARSAKTEEEGLSILASWFVHSLRITTSEGVCQGTPGRVEIGEDPITVIYGSYRCPGSTQSFDLYSRLLDAMGRDHVTFVQVSAGEHTHEAILTGSNSHASFEIGASSTFDKVISFLVLGVEHIFLGFDHVLFLLTLLLVGGSLRRLILVATSFTLAHSITLSLAALELLTFPERIIESVIALSIGWVAIENFRFAEPFQPGKEPFPIRMRWLLTFGFGLVHGFGFAGVLTELGLPKKDLVLSLASFNIGVELGQVAILLLAWPLIKRLDRTDWFRPKGIRGASVAVLAMAAFWFIERAFFWS